MVQRIEIESQLREGIASQSLLTITQMLQQAQQQDVMIDLSLLNDAKKVLNLLKGKNLHRDLHFASKLVFRTQLPSLISLCEELSINPNLLAYHTVSLLSRLSEVDQNLLSIRGALTINDEVLFTKSFNVILRYDTSLLTTIQKFQLVAIIIQHSGYVILRSIFQGQSILRLLKLLKQALTCCSLLLVETEVMDLSRLIISSINTQKNMISSNHINTFHIVNPTNIISNIDKTVNMNTYLEELYKHSPMNLQFYITKFPLLRVSTMYNKQHKQNNMIKETLMIKRKVEFNSAMSYSLNALEKSLLKSEDITQSAENSKIAIELFNLLHYIMKDKPYTSLNKSNYRYFLNNKDLLSSNNISSSSTIEPTSGIIVNIINFIQKETKNSILCDEYYFQLAKQLTDNPILTSMSRGWLLMTIYLHSFTPTSKALPYIKNFIYTSQSIILDEIKNKKLINLYVEEFTLKLIHSIISYCILLINRIEDVLLNDFVDNTINHLPLMNPSIPIIERIFEQKSLDFEVVLLTGI